MGHSFYQQTQQTFQAMYARINNMDGQLTALSQVLKEIVGKELMRGQALHKVLMDKGLVTDAELKKALEDIIAEAKADLEKEAKAAEEQKAKAVEILVPNTVKADSNQDPTPTPAVIPVTETSIAPVVPPTENPSGQV
jgi:Asp-tRNA(Asn)/Glu-tRNA(Gln) amidotransferase B subunit